MTSVSREIGREVGNRGNLEVAEAAVQQSFAAVFGYDRYRERRR